MGRLVVFFGSGIGTGVGLPTWARLLQEVGQSDAGLSADELNALAGLDPRDQARVLQARLGGSEQLAQTVEHRLRDYRYSLAHSLLANLPANQYVTTNWDGLFEEAFADARGGLRVLPYDARRETSAWLLKLHGSVGRPGMVITRSDYLDLMRTRGALASIVEAMLITHHMLFVGYSLRDEDFHSLLDDVQTAIGSTPDPIGTALMVESLPFSDELWKGTLDVISIPELQQDSSSAEAGRMVESALDRIVEVGLRSSPAYFLDDTFEDLLTPDERALAERLRQVRDLVDTTTAVGEALTQFISTLGYGAATARGVTGREGRAWRPTPPQENEQITG